MVAVASMPTTHSTTSLSLPRHLRMTLCRRRMTEQRYGVARLARLSENPTAVELLQTAAGAATPCRFVTSPLSLILP
jgi:hypothetical protein